MCLKTAELVANSVDPDQILHSAASDQGLHCLLRTVCTNTSQKHAYMILTPLNPTFI